MQGLDETWRQMYGQWPGRPVGQRRGPLQEEPEVEAGDDTEEEPEIETNDAKDEVAVCGQQKPHGGEAEPAAATEAMAAPKEVEELGDKANRTTGKAASTTTSSSGVDSDQRNSADQPDVSGKASISGGETSIIAASMDAYNFAPFERLPNASVQRLFYRFHRAKYTP
ncbi:hypothetical protein HPB50_009582 [Hyalomma asiaticum]|uniref:Uncharacterized protein n=1 Tax=Hyalomma asiaticum TaxID=266040 RepID=A0ACB7RP23_HYAAI|nr:hypothetical protein HPB50_009582 [Hyalomma asiaticum]